MPSRARAEVTGPELAEHLRLVLSDLWITLADHLLDDDSGDRLRRMSANGLLRTQQYLSIAEHTLVVYTHRITMVLENDLQSVPFLAELHVPTPPALSDDPGMSVLLLRVSQAAGRLAQVLETLQPAEMHLEWRSERGVSTLGKLVEHALSQADSHLQSAALSARLALHTPPISRAEPWARRRSPACRPPFSRDTFR